MSRHWLHSTLVTLACLTGCDTAVHPFDPASGVDAGSFGQRDARAPGGGEPCRAAAGIDFQSQVAPILTRCTGCHGGTSGLHLDSYAGVMAGGAHGPAVRAGDCASSVLWQKVGPTPPFGDRMPRGGPPWLSDSERQLLCAWIDAGALERPDDSGGGACATCGDGTCSNGEDCASCPDDCGACVGDTQAPEFAGVDYTHESGGTVCSVYWYPATDDVSAAAELRYQIFAASEGQPIDYGNPHRTATEAELLRDEDHLFVDLQLALGSRYTIAVRAVDQAGNRDVNVATDLCKFD